MSRLELISIDALPASVDAFGALRDQVARTPEGGAAMMVLALLVHATDEALGRPCLTMAVDRDRLQEGVGGYQNLRLARTAQSRAGDSARYTMPWARNSAIWSAS